MNSKTKIGFICTGNCTRSQMADGFGKYFTKQLQKDVEIYSAGSHPAGFVHPLAIKAMEEKGIDISNNNSNSIYEIPYDELEYVITLCDSAKETCPIVPDAHTEHWGLPDPTFLEGSEEDRLNAFRQTRDTIQLKVRHLLEKL
ncbi:arsenate reductase ArsC [Candidatus Margulisiibacteriota bacterium]